MHVVSPPKPTSFGTSCSLVIYIILSLSLFIRSSSAGALSDRINGLGQSGYSNVSNPNNGGRTNADSGFCGTSYTAFEEQVMKEALQRVRKDKEKIGRRQTGRTITFDLHVNVVAANLTFQGGWISDLMIKEQVELLNLRYAPTGIQFIHENTTRILSNNWAYGINVPNTDARERLLLNFLSRFKQGDMRTLNVHTSFLASSTSGAPGGGRVLGFSFLPSTSSIFKSVDGVYLHSDVLPGGPSRRYQGGTLIHEVGHWLGLHHTFENGCSIQGDGVDDTPAQMDSSIGCPRGRDSCPGMPGLDPIHNYMDYSDESCQEEFTRGQVERMWDIIDAYRDFKM